MKHKKPLVADVIADLEKRDAAGASDSNSSLTYAQAKKAIELFDGEWIGQDPRKLWAWASSEARKAV